MLRLLPRSRMGVLTGILLLLWVLKTFLLPSSTRQALPAGVRLLWDLLTLLLAIPAVYYSWKLSGVIRRKLLWRLRRRLVLAHVFIGVIPVLLIVVILWIAGLLFYYQFSYYLIENQIGIHAGQLHAFGLSLSAELQHAWSGSAPAPAAIQSLLEQDAKYLLGAYPSAAVVVRLWDTATGTKTILGSGNLRTDRLRDYQDPPQWIEGREFSGLVTEDMQPEIYLRPGGESARAAEGRLYLRSLVAGELRPDLLFTIESSVPLNGYLLGRLKAATGQDLLLAEIVQSSGLNVILQDASTLGDRVISSTFEDASGQRAISRLMWSILLYPTSWATGMETERMESEVLFVELSTTKLTQNLFRSESNVGRTILDVLRIVIGFFLAVELISLMIGIALTKSITGAVHSLYRGTEFIRRGDFSHRIVVKSYDQLGALARSFNQMTEYVQTLVKERVQKERLERELEIAKEVQQQLFPRQAPRLERMELTGMCLPARVVSGDYYDFLQLHNGMIGIALGDICGKGISAALLMANLQATLRSNVMNISRNPGDSFAAASAGNSVSQIMALLNQQIYQHTAANKFASLFYAVYDDASLSLTYCNAGHNPPLYFSNDHCRRLETGGTVVGIFADASFEQETVRLQPGDLLLAYTDGIVECVNEYGEEFGEERLIDLVRRHFQMSAAEIQKVLVEEVIGWTYEKERDDDMTLIVGKIR